jgi:hypothetical protein
VLDLPGQPVVQGDFPGDLEGVVRDRLAGEALSLGSHQLGEPLVLRG